ncbi:hypothetical protein CRBSH125_05970 [Afipia carboxidovorans]|nr:hypothetical protein CRBSH125_05970 [Afipia carboxidovorans]
MQDSPAPTSEKPVDPAKPAAVADSPDASLTPAEPIKPEWAGDFWDAEKNELKSKEFGDHFKTLTEKAAAADARAALVPADAKSYKFEIPADLKLPEGMAADTVKVDMDDPLLQIVIPIMHEGQVPNDVAQKLYGAVLQSRVNEVATLNERAAAERAAIGVDAPARVAAIGTFLTSHLGVDNAKAMMSGVFTANQVKGFEALMQKFAGGSVLPFNQNGKDASAEAGKIAGFENMSFEQRRAAQDAAARR